MTKTITAHDNWCGDDVILQLSIYRQGALVKVCNDKHMGLCMGILFAFLCHI